MKKIVLLILVLFCMRALLNAENKKEIKNKIRHGKVITKENFKIYEKELKKLLPSSHFLSYENAVKNGWITIPVIKKQKYYPPKGFIDATYKNKGKCKIVPVNQLIGWEAGLPFPDPKNSTELGWNTYRRRQMAEDLEIFFSFFLFNKGIELERTFKIRLWKKFWVGRTDIPPMPELPDNKGVLNSKESIVVSSPYDVKGFSFVRIRYEDITKDDAVFSYIPALRRIRRLTGSDVCDPMLGSDQIYDDFECWREKITSKMTFKKLGVKEFLVPCHYTKKPPQGFRQKNCFQTEWEKRPLWMLEVHTNNEDYAYSKRILYIEKEDMTCSLYGGEFYDQSGRLWRGYGPIVQAHDEKTLFRCWWGYQVLDIISGHSTIMRMYPKLRDIIVPMEVFTIKGLLKKAK